MVSDKREFARLDVGYFDNPKIADAIEASPFAALAHLASMAYARQHRTDGVVSVKRILRKVGATDADAKILFDLGLWHDLGEGHAELHDYLEHQESADQIRKLSAAGKKGADSRWSGNRSAVRPEKGSADGDAIRSADRIWDADRIPDGTADRYAEERRGEERRATAREAAPEVPDRPDMNPDAILQSHGMPENERPAFKAWLREHRNVRSLAPWLTKVQAAGEVPDLIQAWRATTKPKKLHPSRDPASPHYAQEWMFNQ